MFFPQRMKKLNVIVLKNYADELVKEILEFGDFEVIQLKKNSEALYELKKEGFDDRMARFQEYRRRTAAIAQFFGVDIDEIPERHSNFMDEIVIKNSLLEIEGKITNYNKQVENLKKHQNDILIKLDSIRFFSDIDLDLKTTQDVKHFFMGFGSIPGTGYKAFTDSLATIPSVVMNVGTVDNQNMVFFTVPVNYKETVDKILQNVYFKNYGIPKDISGTIRSNIVKYGFELSLTHDEELYLDKQLIKMKANFGSKIGELIKSIDYHMSIVKVKSEMTATNSINLLSGWVPSDMVETLKGQIEEITSHKCYFLEEEDMLVQMRDGIYPPTKLKNPKILKPFENFVTMFGTPNYKELDPTLPMAILYVFMFGAMFGDAGHGAIIAILGILLMIPKKMKNIRWLAQILVMVGLSSVLFGFLYGAMFGEEYHLLNPLWLSPRENIMTILGVSAGFGALVISVGLIFGTINSARLKDYGAMLFGSKGIAGILFYWGLLFVGVMAIMGKPYPHWMIAIPIGAAVLILFEKRLAFWIFHHGEKVSIALGFVEIFESTLSMLSNTISFLRVGAFALNHGALESAVFILGEMSNGPVGKAIILVIGNLFVIVLEGMIVGIQALRLEYYEFFVKFFRADGNEFKGFDIYKKQRVR